VGQRAGAEIALLSLPSRHTEYVPAGFELVPACDVEVRVHESPRRGAPMALVRGGEDRDLAAIVAMGTARAASFRFHLDRDVDRVKHAITSKRLLAGLASPGDRQLRFMIAEEGITAAAYVVLTITEGTWTIEECGDRDASGARVGAILQTLIAQEPGERRPRISGWLPPVFAPPQVTITPAPRSEDLLLIRRLGTLADPLILAAADVLYWHSDAC
jgi:hypothetical protein